MTTLAEVLATGHGVERTFTCPMHGDTNPSASVNTIKMVWVCYACGAHGRVGGEALALDIDIDAARRYLMRKREDAHPKPEGWLKLYESSHPYWRSRFTEATIRHYALGHDYELDAATYPLRSNEGDVLGVVRRPLGESGSKYLYPYGMDISNLLFDYHRADSDVLVLTEGATDAMAGWECWLGASYCAIYGRAFSAAQATLVRRLDPRLIICAFDQDEAGKSAYSEVLYRLPEYRVARMYWDVTLGKDLASMDLETRTENLIRALDPWHSKA